MNTKIRKIAAQDIEAVVRIIGSHDKFDGKCADRYFTEYFSDPKRVDSPDEEHFVVIEDATKRILGVSGYTPDQYRTPGIYWVGWTYVDRDFQRKRLGSTIFQYVIDIVSQKEARKLYIDTSSDAKYQPAVAFYKHFGFQTEGVLKDYYEAEEDYLILGKEL